MKLFPLFLVIANLFLGSILFAQPLDQQDYYKGIDFSKNGTALKAELSNLVTSTHTRHLSYTPGIWEASKITDLNPNNNNEVLLLYGWPEGASSDYRREYRRYKNKNGGNNGEWNREHTYPRSLGTPNLNYQGPGADAHHIRPCDVEWNASRGNLKFINSKGNSRIVSNGWYPGDEWKGDVARMMMYMYIRYGNQCLPANVGIGSTVKTPDGMIDLFLKWNAEDPVSEIEIQRNEYHSNTKNTYAQGNRNPFIDNPYLATKIWGGISAENRWDNLSTTKTQNVEFAVYPNPTYNQKVFVQTETPIHSIRITTITGQIIRTVNNPETQTNNTYSLENLPKGFYFIHIKNAYGESTKKIIVK